MVAVPKLALGGKSGNGGGGGRKVLVVDDERHIVRLVQVNLERVGFEVVTAFDGKEALEQIAAEQPDLVILDVMMPYVDGFAVLRAIRQNPATCRLPVLMLTARAQDADVLQGWKEGAEYLTKPFSPKSLLAILRKLFDGPPYN